MLRNRRRPRYPTVALQLFVLCQIPTSVADPARAGSAIGLWCSAGMADPPKVRVRCRVDAQRIQRIVGYFVWRGLGILQSVGLLKASHVNILSLI